MSRARRLVETGTWTITAFLALAALILSTQREDYLHSASFLHGLRVDGLSFYRLSASIENIGGSAYLPGLYLLLQASILPATILASLSNSVGCTISNQEIGWSCIAESVSLKLASAALAYCCVSLLLALNRKADTRATRERSLIQSRQEKSLGALRITGCLLFFPSIFYSIFLFSGYDGIGAFTTLLGGILYFKAASFSGASRKRELLLSIAGILLASLGISAKYFPIIFLLGTCAAFARTWKHALLGTAIPFAALLLQIALTHYAGGHPFEILSKKASEASALASYPLLIGVLLTGLYLLFLALKYRSSPNSRISYSCLATLGIFSLLFPSILWHSQWQLYYGLSLLCAWLAISPRGRMATITKALVCMQIFSFLLSLQFFAWNADITMSLASLKREPLDNSIVVGAGFKQPRIVMPLGVHVKVMPSLFSTLRHKPVGKALRLGWLTYNATQILLLITFTCCLFTRRPASNGDHAVTSNLALIQQAYLAPSALFLILWYGLAGISVLLAR